MKQIERTQGVMMSSVPELKATLTLPKTAFPMKANLPQNEPLRLARWASMGLYEELRKAGERAARLAAPISCCTTALPTPTAPFTWATH